MADLPLIHSPHPTLHLRHVLLHRVRKRSRARNRGHREPCSPARSRGHHKRRRNIVRSRNRSVPARCPPGLSRAIMGRAARR